MEFEKRPEPDAAGRRAPRGGPVCAVLLAAVIGPAAVFAVVRSAGLDRGFVLVWAMAALPYLVPVLVLAAAAALLLRRRGAALCAGLTGLALAVPMADRVLPEGGAAEPDGPRIRVVALNAHFGHVAPEQIVDLVDERRPDVLALQEVTPELAGGLREAGLEERLPHGVVRAAEAAAGGAVYAAHPVRDAGDVGREIGSLAMPGASVEIDGAPPVEVVSVHPFSPRRSTIDRWRAGLRALPAAEEGVLRVLAGDFNATPDHAEFRAVLEKGYVDAADATGSGLAGTWPAPRPVPRIALDHVLADERIGIAGFEVDGGAGGAHRAVVADLVLPAA